MKGGNMWMKGGNLISHSLFVERRDCLLCSLSLSLTLLLLSPLLRGLWLFGLFLPGLLDSLGRRFVVGPVVIAVAAAAVSGLTNMYRHM